MSFITSLMREMPGGRLQYEAVLIRIARRLNVEAQVENALDNLDLQPRGVVDTLFGGLRSGLSSDAFAYRDVVRAMSLLSSNNIDTKALAFSWLQGYDADESARTMLGFHGPPLSPKDLVAGMSWAMSLAGPTMVAVDQIDGVVNPSNIRNGDVFDSSQSLASVLMAGFLDLHQVSRRGQTVVTCLFDSWQRLQQFGSRAAEERFRPPPAVLIGLNNKTAAAALVASRLKPAFAAAEFTPPYATWPFSASAIDQATSVGMLPRTLLMRCDAYVRACLEAGAIGECESLIVARPSASHSTLGFAETYIALRNKVDTANSITSNDDAAIGQLLRKLFDLFVAQTGPDEAVDLDNKGETVQRIPPLHGRLTFTYRQENDRERHVCYRALQHDHAISFQARLRAALTASGISAGTPWCQLVILRRGPVPSGPKTRQLTDAFLRAGGLLIDPSEDDLRSFLALSRMNELAAKEGRLPLFEAWLRADKPLLATAFFRAIGLADGPDNRHGAATAGMPEPVPATPKPAIDPGPPQQPPATPEAAPDAISVGTRVAPGGAPVALPLRLLPRHTAIIAGSGSGKTVLLRRLVEEAALAGVPAVVIDPNNDLSRLGEPWPAPPNAFTAEDEAKARRYRDTVEVVVWTPGVHAGNPLSLPVLPDFIDLADDRDELQGAVEMAAATLVPLAGARSTLHKGVLAEALRHFAGRGGGDLAAFTALLADLPDGVSPIAQAPKLAAGMADQLHAAVATNPLLRTDAPPLEPQHLFFGGDAGRTRVSVINLSGFASDTAREDFVNRLQMTLFAWIKRRPSGSGLLYVVDEAQSFLPSQKPALSLGSGLRLVAQARKYGLGMIVATQVPKGIHNQVVSNCTTQFLGRQSAPATIAAAQEMVAAASGQANDIARLRAGEFYFWTDGSGRPEKIRTSLCLSFHPPTPPGPDEVVARARASREAGA